MAHTCHAVGCDKQVPPKRLMCADHWKMVPAGIKADIWEQYVPGQEIRKDPTWAYIEARNAAIRSVAVQEGREVPFWAEAE